MIPLLFAALALMAQEAPLAIPFSAPDHSLLSIDHSDVRTLAEGGTATFRQHAEVTFSTAGGALVASYRLTGRHCNGPEAICAAFFRLGAGADGRVFRFRIGMADHSVTLLDAVNVPLSAAEGEGASAVATFVSQSEAAAPGAILAADLRQLLRFADTPLPAVGEMAVAPGGMVRLMEWGGAHALVALQWTPRTTDAVSLNGGGECRISRATGLVEHCRFADWAGEASTAPLRVREVRVTLVPMAVP